MFARYGLPHTVVSDNGTYFTSHEFEDFLKANGIQHIKTAPYYPQCNALLSELYKHSIRGWRRYQVVQQTQK